VDLALAEAALGVAERAFDQAGQVRGGERLQQVDARPRKQCGVEFERRVLGGRADEHQRAVLDEWQERVLLRLVEAMHFVEEQHRRRAALAPRRARLFDGLANVLDAGNDRRQRDEMRFAGLCREPRERRLAAAGRAPQDHRVRDAIGQQPVQWPARREQVLLADEFRQLPRPHAVRERAVGAGRRRLDREF
jgi:hypothetical protein